MVARKQTKKKLPPKYDMDRSVLGTYRWKFEVNGEYPPQPNNQSADEAMAAAWVHWHTNQLAKTASGNTDAVTEITRHKGQLLFESAKKAHLSCPNEGDWIGTVLACNTPINPSAKYLIHTHARSLWDAWMQSQPTVTV